MLYILLGIGLVILKLQQKTDWQDVFRKDRKYRFQNLSGNPANPW
jgi:hypothetical protein